MSTEQSVLKRDTLVLEAKRVKSLLELCVSSGIDPGLATDDIDLIIEDNSELAYYAQITRLREVHRHLHELLYAPPRR